MLASEAQREQMKPTVDGQTSTSEPGRERVSSGGNPVDKTVVGSAVVFIEVRTSALNEQLRIDMAGACWGISMSGAQVEDELRTPLCRFPEFQPAP